MTEDAPRGPVIFAGLYALCIVLTVVVLAWHDRWNAEVIRAWAPLLQAVLGALAIFSAWLLQDAKRKADQRDELQALAASYRALSYELERWAAWFDDLAQKGSLTKLVLTNNTQQYHEEVELLRRLPLQNLRSEAAIRHTYRFIVSSRQMATVLFEQKARVDGGRSISEAQVADRAKNLVERRSDMLRALNLESEPYRLSTVKRAKGWMDEREAHYI